GVSALCTIWRQQKGRRGNATDGLVFQDIKEGLPGGRAERLSFSGSFSAGRPPRMVVCSTHDLEPRSRDESKKLSCAWPPLSCQNFPLSCRLLFKGSERKAGTDDR